MASLRNTKSRTRAAPISIPRGPSQSSRSAISISPSAFSPHNYRSFHDADEEALPVRWRFRQLIEPVLTAELARQALATRYDAAGADAVSFQPCCSEDERNQDRYVVQTWDLGGPKPWRFVALFDGHAGHEMAEHAVVRLPLRVRDALQAHLQVHPLDRGVDTKAIGALLARTISELDDDALSELLALFPAPATPTAPSAARDPLAGAIAASTAALSTLSDDALHAIVSDPANLPVVTRSARGTTAVLALVDPGREHLWVASLGDSVAAFGTRTRPRAWDVRVLSADHSGTNAAEAARVRAAHPGEDGCLMRNRVLGALAVTRALGDHAWRLPATWTERVFLHPAVRCPPHYGARDFRARIRTPPYLLNTADVQYVALQGEQMLVLCSDGLTDLFRAGPTEAWFDVIDRAGKDANGAVALLREGLGGADVERVSRMMTVEMFERWMDDTTVVVLRL